MEGSRISWGPHGLGLLRLSRNSWRKVRAGPSGSFLEGNATKRGQSHALKFSWLHIFNNKKENGVGVFTSVPLPLCPSQLGRHDYVTTILLSPLPAQPSCTELSPGQQTPRTRAAAPLESSAGCFVFRVYFVYSITFSFSSLSPCFRWRIQGTRGKISKTTRLLRTGNVSICSWSPCPLSATGMFMQKPRWGVSSWSSLSSGDW